MNTDRDKTKPTEKEFREALERVADRCVKSSDWYATLQDAITELMELRELKEVIMFILPYLEMKLSGEDIKRIKGVMKD